MAALAVQGVPLMGPVIALPAVSVAIGQLVVVERPLRLWLQKCLEQTWQSDAPPPAHHPHGAHGQRPLTLCPTAVLRGRPLPHQTLRLLLLSRALVPSSMVVPTVVELHPSRRATHKTR